MALLAAFLVTAFLIQSISSYENGYAATPKVSQGVVTSGATVASQSVLSAPVVVPSTVRAVIPPPTARVAVPPSIAPAAVLQSTVSTTIPPAAASVKTTATIPVAVNSEQYNHYDVNNGNNVDNAHHGMPSADNSMLYSNQAASNTASHRNNMESSDQLGLASNPIAVKTDALGDASNLAASNTYDLNTNTLDIDTNTLALTNNALGLNSNNFGSNSLDANSNIMGHGGDTLDANSQTLGLGNNLGAFDANSVLSGYHALNPDSYSHTMGGGQISPSDASVPSDNTIDGTDSVAGQQQYLNLLAYQDSLATGVSPGAQFYCAPGNIAVAIASGAGAANFGASAGTGLGTSLPTGNEASPVANLALSPEAQGAFDANLGAGTGANLGASALPGLGGIDASAGVDTGNLAAPASSFLSGTPTAAGATSVCHCDNNAYNTMNSYR